MSKLEELEKTCPGVDRKVLANLVYRPVSEKLARALASHVLVEGALAWNGKDTAGVDLRRMQKVMEAILGRLDMPVGADDLWLYREVTGRAGEEEAQ